MMQMPMSLFVGNYDIYVRRGNSRSINGFDFETEFRQSKFRQFRRQNVAIHAESYQSPEDHVAAGTGETVEMQ